MKRNLCLLSFVFIISLTLHAQIGKVGINTTTPAAMLHVKDSSVVFTGAATTPNLAGLPPVGGPGVRMMWYPDKAAFREGLALGQQWDRDSTGKYSVAMGYDVRASKISSVAIGNHTKADGNYSIALGADNITSGQQSSALGSFLTASGYWSTAIGVGCVSSGSPSFSMGSNNIASGDQATAIGAQTTATGDLSTAIGSHTVSSGNSSFSTGEYTVAVGYVSTALGSFTDAIGSYSTSMGFQTKATGHTSTAMGNNSKANGDRATAMGSFTMAKPFAAVALGQYNDTTSISSTTWDLNDPLLIVGNGTSNTERSNALTILKNSKTGINTSSPDAMLHVIKDTPTNGPYNINSAAIFEGGQGSFIQLSNNDDIQSGILSGNEVTSLRSALIFSADSSVQIRTGGNTARLSIEKDGKIGIGTVAPQRLLHISNGGGGNLYHADSDFILEDNGHTYLQFSSPTGSASGLLAGNAVTDIRSALLFMADSTVQIRSGGNATNLTIDKSGNTNTTGEIRRPSTGAANMVPVCYGSVDAAGAILSGSGNFSVSITPPGYYEITITGEPYTNSAYTTSATPVSSNPRLLSTGNSGGKLVVRTFTAASALVDTLFHFVVYKN